MELSIPLLHAHISTFSHSHTPILPYSHTIISLFSNLILPAVRNARPLIGSEGNSGKSFLVIEIGVPRIVSPCIVYGYRILYLVRINYNLIFLEEGLGIMKMMVWAGYFKGLNITVAVFYQESAARMGKI